VNERWVCKRCFSSNEGTVGACARCGLTRGAESSAEDQQSWGAQAGVGAPAGPQPAWRGLLRYWWIPALAIFLAVGYFTTARRGDDGSLSTSGTVSVDDLQVGDCFNSGEEIEISSVDGRPCGELHQYEVFAIDRYEADSFPTTDAQMEEVFYTVCDAPFESYVGVSYAESALWASMITPSEETWASGDREFICYLHEEDESDFTGSMRGSNR
jgi:hypothetical protein